MTMVNLSFPSLHLETREKEIVRVSEDEILREEE